MSAELCRHHYWNMAEGHWIWYFIYIIGREQGFFQEFTQVGAKWRFSNRRGQDRAWITCSIWEVWGKESFWTSKKIIWCYVGVKLHLQRLVVTNEMLITMFPTIDTLTNICLLIPVGTVSVEWFFSKMKIIKTKLRNHIGEASHSYFMKISTASPQNIIWWWFKQHCKCGNRKNGRLGKFLFMFHLPSLICFFSILIITKILGGVKHSEGGANTPTSTVRNPVEKNRVENVCIQSITHRFLSTRTILAPLVRLVALVSLHLYMALPGLQPSRPRLTSSYGQSIVTRTDVSSWVAPSERGNCTKLSLRRSPF